jgi:hypothetical protein
LDVGRWTFCLFFSLSRIYCLRGSRTEQPHPRRRGGFTPRQQAVYRKIVEDAWSAFCRQHYSTRDHWSVGAARSDRVAKEHWYREVLHTELGVFTTKQLNKTGDFEKACAAFEIIGGQSIYWQLRVTAGPVERARLELKDLARIHDLEEHYINGISNQMFGTHASNLDATKLNKLVAALKIHFKRQSEPDRRQHAVS